MNIRLRNTTFIFLLLAFSSCGEASKSATGKNTVPEEKPIKVLTFDEAIQMAKEIDQHPEKECYIDYRPFHAPSYCYVDDRLVKVVERTTVENRGPDTTVKYRCIPRREFFFINEDYTVVIHSIFNNPTALENKWKWFRMVFKRKKLLRYAYYKRDSLKEYFIDSSTTRFKDADKYIPDYIEMHQVVYSDLPKVLLNPEMEKF